MPRYSIITVCYNEIAHIRDTLDSIKNQTFKDFEMIVIDGGSTDGTRDVILQYQPYLKWWCSEPDNGIYHAMNKGVSHASGEYVIFMNGGDCFHSGDVLERMERAHVWADIVEGQALRADTKELIRNQQADLLHKLLSDGISHQSTFIRRSLFDVYRYDENYRIASDWKFWLQTIAGEGCSYQYVDFAVADIDTAGITYSQFARNLRERDAILEELSSSPKLSFYAFVFRQYNYLTHNALVQYAMYLDRNSRFGYSLVRKIAKRVVRMVGRK